MRKLLICSIALALAGCNSEVDVSQLSWKPQQDGRTFFTEKGKPATGSVTRKNDDGSTAASFTLKDGYLVGEYQQYMKGALHTKSNYQDGHQVGSFEQFCADGKIEIKRQIKEWPTTFSEEAISCKTGELLRKINKVNDVSVGEQILWTEQPDGTRHLVSHITYDEQGKEHGEAIKYSGVKSKTVANYENGVLHGPYTEYDFNGDLLAEGAYQDGVKVGVWRKNDGYTIADKSALNPIDFNRAIYAALSLEVNSKDRLIINTPTHAPKADREKLKFYIDQGKLDLKKPVSTTLDLLVQRYGKDEGFEFNFAPITNIAHADDIEWLIEQGADINAVDSNGHNRLMKCLALNARGCTAEHVQMLIGVTDLNTKDFNGRTVGHLVCGAGSVASKSDEKAAQWRRLILEKADLNVQDKFGWSAAHYCLARGFTESATQLLARGADFTLANGKGVTAAQMVWLKTSPGQYQDQYAVEWDQARIDVAVALQKAGALSFHTKLPVFEKTIRDLGMEYSNIDLVKMIDSIEPI